MRKNSLKFKYIIFGVFAVIFLLVLFSNQVHAACTSSSKPYEVSIVVSNKNQEGDIIDAEVKGDLSFCGGSGLLGSGSTDLTAIPSEG